MKYFAPAALILSLMTVSACSPSAEKSDEAEVVPATTGPLARPIRGDGGMSDFYTYAAPLPDKPGVLLRTEDLSAAQSVPGAAQNIRLLYTSTDGVDNATRIPVSGGLFLPSGDAPEGGWPLLAWTHGTVGIADICAPTITGYRPFHQEHLRHWLEQGYAVVTSDYQGLGTAGTHPYLATRPASYNNLDVIRAVQGADYPLSKRVVLAGQSQGAAAALASAGYAPDYAPELDIGGVVATGVPYFTPRTLEIIAETRPRDVVDPMLGYNFLALTLVEQLDPTFRMEDFVSDAALPVARASDDTCYLGMRDKVKAAGLTYDLSFKSEPTQALGVAFAAMGYPRLDVAVPVFVGSGRKDRDTPLRMQAGLVKTACAAGARIEAYAYAEHDHLTVLNHSTRDSTAFVERAFEGVVIPGNCDALPY